MVTRAPTARRAFTSWSTGPAASAPAPASATSAVVPVAAAPRVVARTRRVGRRVTVTATITPALPGATVQLQRYVRERFDYLPIRTVRSKSGASVRFSFRSRHRNALRVAVTKAPGGWSPGLSGHTVVARGGGEHMHHHDCDGLRSLRGDPAGWPESRPVLFSSNTF